MTKTRKTNKPRRTLGEEQYRLLAEGIQHYAISMLDPLSHIISWNIGTELIKGYGAQEIVGKHFSIFRYAPEVRQIAEALPFVEVIKRSRMGRCAAP